MNDVYENNLKALSERDKSAHDIYVNSPEQIKDDIVKPFFDANGCLCATKDGSTFRLESAYDSERYLSIWSEYIRRKSNISSKLIMFGLGNGMMAGEYLKSMPKEHEIIIYEPLISVFDFVMKNCDISNIINNERVHLYVDGLGYEKDFNNFLAHKIKLQDVKTTIIEVYENYQLLYADRIGDFFDSIRKCLSGVLIDTNFIASYATTINENIENNMKYYMNSLSLHDLKGRGEGIPAIIVGAGPSLDKNICKMQMAKEKAIIIATDSAVRTLVRNEIIPDVIVTMDPFKDDTYLIGDSCAQIPLVTSLHSGWRLTAAHNGPCYFTNSTDIMTNRFSIAHDIFVQSLQSGGSVAHLAFSVAQHMRCEPIIFTGMDLAYPNNKSHSSDSIVASVTVEELKGNIPVKDINGNDVMTSEDMLRYKRWIEAEIKKYSKKNFIDATEGGALIEGTIVLPLAEAIETYCNREYQIASIFTKISKVYSPDLQKELVEYLSDTPAHMKHNLERLDDLETLYTKMFDMILNKSFSARGLIDMQQEANGILDEIETDPLADFTNNLIQNERNRLFGDINIVGEDETENIKETLRIGLEYAGALRKAISEALPYAERMAESLQQVGDCV